MTKAAHIALPKVLTEMPMFHWVSRRRAAASSSQRTITFMGARIAQACHGPCKSTGFTRGRFNFAKARPKVKQDGSCRPLDGCGRGGDVVPPIDVLHASAPRTHF